ncbi:MAG: hypothetical protein LBO80_12055 [Treponema sp.]|nr:hypothetical protein [Treponema sp.]
MKEKLLAGILFLISLIIPVQGFSQGFPLFGIKLGDTPGRVKALMTINADGFSLKEDLSHDNWILYQYHGNSVNLIFWFVNEKLSNVIGGCNSELRSFDSLASEIRGNWGEPSQYAKPIEFATWDVTVDFVVMQIFLFAQSKDGKKGYAINITEAEK